jgi:peptidoglycan hydrolase-like protein with peptidoglycan-binding domain
MSDPGLEVGAQGEAVSRLQQSLGQAGYPIPLGEITRRFFGPSTRNAVRSYQQDHALPVSGAADPGTLVSLAASTPPNPAGVIGPEVVPAPRDVQVSPSQDPADRAMPQVRAQLTTVPHELALWDLVSPYVLEGDTFGQWHAALAVIYVSEYTMAADDLGIVVRGVGRFSGDVSPYVDPSTMTFGVNAENTEGHPANDAGRRDPWIDVRDAQIDFELSAPREVSQKVASAVSNIGSSAGFAGCAAVLKAYDANTADPPPSDYASTAFVLDLVLTTAVLRPPFLRGAKLDPSGILLDDPTHVQVKITLPKIKVRLSQGSQVTDPLTATLLSLGASGLDDQDDIGVADLITMDPPYAFIGPWYTVGIGFRTAILDLAQGSTPPDVLTQFGFDDSWMGLYLPELRVYVRPNGAEDLAIDASATNLLIGFGPSAGITGDFELAVVDQGSGPVTVSARFYDANQRCYGITKSADGQTATVAIPDHTRMVIDIDGGLTPYTASAQIGSAPDAPGRLFDVSFGAATCLSIVISATGSQPGATKTKLIITANLKPASAPPPPGTTPTPDNPAVRVETTSVTTNGSAVTEPQLTLISQTSNQATIGLDVDPTTAASTQWVVNGTPAGTCPVLSVDCGPGVTVNVCATLPGPPGVGSGTAYFRFDHPKPNCDNPDNYALIPANTRTVAAPDQVPTSPWPGGSDVTTALYPLLKDLPADCPITVCGYASYEAGDQTAESSNAWQYNNQLAANRAEGLKAIITAYPGTNFTNVTCAPDMSNWPNQGPGLDIRRCFWKAVATWPPQPGSPTVTAGTVSRPAAQPPQPAPVPDCTLDASPPPPPSWFKKVDAKVRIVRDHFVACEISGEFDIQTPTENELAHGRVPGGQIPQWGNVGSQNPGDGIICARIVVQLDDATDVVTVSGYFGADPADLDGLYYLGWLPPAPAQLPDPSYGLDFFGLGVAFWPLIADSAGAAAADGAAVELAVTGAGFAVVAGIACLPWFRVERVIWYGGEFDLQARPDGDELMVLVDIETAISADISIESVDIVTIPRTAPLVVRYKAIGFILGNPAGQPRFQFRPYFDSSKGYTIDVSKPGAIQVHHPFDQILKILGARLARNNPLMLEVDLGFAVDLGVVSIDQAGIRLNLSPGGPPELTAFGASVDIPGALSGRGYAQIGHDANGDSVIEGALDLAITPVNIRIAATLAIAQISPQDGGPATGVLASLEVDFPVAIPLADSGLGIYGFIGLFAMNFERDMGIIPAGNVEPPELAWLKAAHGDVSNPQYWVPRINSWAFGLGALLGTEGTDFLINLKGLVLLELPGPRLLIVMKANVLADAPGLRDDTEGVILAVIDLDFGRGTLTIGLSIDFSIDPLIEIKIPAGACFDFNDAGDWSLYLGRYDDQVQATIFDIFDASGYLMLSGSGIPAHNNLPAVGGFSVAVGLHISFCWGGGPLYAQLAAGFDAVVGFSPFRLAGTLSVRGALHLFIIDISAYAELDVDVGQDNHGCHVACISGQLCGEVDFLFFSISGCVTLTIGNDATVPDPPGLVKSVKLISRSPTLVVGTGVDKPIDSSLADAVEADSGPTPATLPCVPIDVIPALMLAMPPLQDPALCFLGQTIGGTPDAPSDGWVQRGDVWYKYTLTEVTLKGPVTPGKTPATWWNTKAGDKALEAQLALLSWVPDPTPKAVGSSSYLDQTTTEKWGTVCQPAAPPAPVFWTFFFQILGPSDSGWQPFGLAYPDPPGTVRSALPDLSLFVTERWRCGDRFIDQMRGIVPAEVEGAAVPCPSPPAATAMETVMTTATAAPAVSANHPPAADPVTAIRGGLTGAAAAVPDEALTIADVVQRFSAGQAVARASLSQLTLAPPGPRTGIAAAPPGCFGWALASPIFDDGKPVDIGDQAREPVIVAAWNQRGFKPGPLDDAVVFNFGPFEYARFYLWIPTRLMYGETICVAACDANDHFYSEHVITGADALPAAPLPTAWTDPASPWEPAVVVLNELHALVAGNYTAVFVEIPGTADTDRVQIGCLPASRPLRRVITHRPFYVGGIEALKTSEVTRSSYDTTQQVAKQCVLQDALGLDSADNALLQPGQQYTVTVTWDACREKRPEGQPPSDQQTWTSQTQSFSFCTDSTPPIRLDPWVLVALPGEAEPHYFASETVKVVFATSNVGEIYAAYGKKLQARLRPSSCVPVPSSPTVPHPYPLSPAHLQPVPAAVLSPWENAVQKLVGTSAPCVAICGERTRHVSVTIPIPLDLYTDYLLDIEMLDTSAADGSPGTLVWRGSFSTGGYRTAADFAQSFQITKVNHRGVFPEDCGKLQAIGPLFAAADPQGAQFDDALAGAGLPAMPVPKIPAVTVFWDPGSPIPQPAALLIDAPEPMWRDRPIPTLITDPPPASAQRYELQPQPWLKLVQQPGGDNVVDYIVPAPGGQRALVTLKPGSRGQRVTLGLVRCAHTEAYLDGPAATDQFYTVLDQTLTAAPWEEVD